MTRLPFSALPPDSGLYKGANEHDACGVAMVAGRVRAERTEGRGASWNL